MWDKERDERREQKDKGCRDHKQRMQLEWKGLRSSAAVVLMAGESMVDEAYYVGKIILHNGSLTQNNINKHGKESTTKPRSRFSFQKAVFGQGLHMRKYSNMCNGKYRKTSDDQLYV